MRTRAVWREAWRNVTTGTVRVATWAVVFGVIAIGLTLADLVTVRSIVQEAERFQAAGASVVTLEAVGRIDGESCVALADVDGVRAAGALRAVDPGPVAAALPSASIPLLEVTPGVPRVLRAQADGPGVVVSADVAETLALDPGDELVTRTDRAVVAGVYNYPDDGRRPGYGYAVLAPVPPDGVFDECWADVWPASVDAPALLRTAVLAGGDVAEQPVLSQLNTTHGVAFDGAGRFDERLTRWASVVALVLAAAVGYVSVRTRRLHLAADLHVGVPRSALALRLFLEGLGWVVPVVVVAAATVVVFAAAGAPDDRGVTAVLGGRVVALSVVGVLLGAAAAFILTREKHLFRYFKDR